MFFYIPNVCLKFNQSQQTAAPPTPTVSRTNPPGSARGGTRGAASDGVDDAQGLPLGRTPPTARPFPGWGSSPATSCKPAPCLFPPEIPILLMGAQLLDAMVGPMKALVTPLMWSDGDIPTAEALLARAQGMAHTDSF